MFNQFIKYNLQFTALVLLFIAFQKKAPAQTKSDKPIANLQIEMNGITPSYPASSISELRMETPPGSLFYREKSPVSGNLILTISSSEFEKGKQWIISNEWPNYFHFEGLTKFSANKKLPEYFSSKEFLLEWGIPKFTEELSTSKLCSVTFSLLKVNRQPLDPGVYQFMTSGFLKGAPFQLQSVNSNFMFAVSDFTTREDSANWYEAEGERLWTLAPPDSLEPIDRAKENLKNKKLAIEQWKNGLGLFPDDDNLLLKIATNLELINQHSMALNYYSKVLVLWEKWQKLGRVTYWNHLHVKYNNWVDFRDELTQHIRRIEKFIEKKK